MKLRTALLATAGLLTFGCDEEPNFTAEPGVEVCERIVAECGDLCDTESTDPIDEGSIRCSFDSEPDHFECGVDIIKDAGLQEAHDWPGTPYNALTAAEGVTVGFYPDCVAALGTLPVFCYGCRD